MDRRMAVTVVAALLVAALLLSVSTAGEVRLWHDPPPADRFDRSAPVETAPPVTSPFGLDLETGDGLDLPRWLLIAIRVVAATAFLLAVVALARAAWRRRPRLRWRGGDSQHRIVAMLPDVARTVTDDAEAQRTTLLRGAPRNAIVECWLRLEEVVAAAGLPRDPAHTSVEFTSRVLASYAMDATAIVTLSALYREARFSTHEMGEDQRHAAVEALDAIHDSLRSHLAPPVGAAAGGAGR